MNHAAHVHDHKSNLPMMLSVYLDVEISEDQLEMFNPNPVDFLMGSIMQDKIGCREKNRKFPNAASILYLETLPDTPV